MSHLPRVRQYRYLKQSSLNDSLDRRSTESRDNNRAQVNFLLAHQKCWCRVELLVNIEMNAIIAKGIETKDRLLPERRPILSHLRSNFKKTSGLGRHWLKRIWKIECLDFHVCRIYIQHHVIFHSCCARHEYLITGQTTATTDCSLAPTILNTWMIWINWWSRLNTSGRYHGRRN